MSNSNQPSTLQSYVDSGMCRSSCADIRKTDSCSHRCCPECFRFSDRFDSRPGMRRVELREQRTRLTSIEAEAQNRKAEAQAKDDASHATLKLPGMTATASGVTADDTRRSEGSWNQTIGSGMRFSLQYLMQSLIQITRQGVYRLDFRRKGPAARRCSPEQGRPGTRGARTNQRPRQWHQRPRAGHCGWCLLESYGR